eukprot:jgi/Tetstr1/445912/TSEL_033541.t1
MRSAAAAKHATPRSVSTLALTSRLIRVEPRRVPHYRPQSHVAQQGTEQTHHTAASGRMEAAAEAARCGRLAHFEELRRALLQTCWRGPIEDGRSLAHSRRAGGALPVG